MSTRNPREGASISKTELKVAPLIAEDLADKQIADRLSMKQKTVEKHIAGLRAKLGVRSKIGIAVWWTQRAKEQQ